ncbi:hypothetical protein MWU59_06965 [Flavobacteriaceae bacterium F08102]|nr:hypothetical protein [Flavobacteriaceae bacterium F08102]
MKEKPAYEILVKKYADNENIAMLSVSIDTKKVWQNYYTKETPIGLQLQIDKSELAAYQVVSIPRIFVFDKEQKIVDVFAPRPSSGELEELLTSIYRRLSRIRFYF